MCLIAQASERRIHLIVSRQARQQGPDIFQEAGWSSNGGQSPGPEDRSDTPKVRPGQGIPTTSAGNYFLGWLHTLTFLRVVCGLYHVNTMWLVL